MAERDPHYRAFLLRLWRADSDGQPVWRLSLEEAGTKQQHLFHSFSAAETFLVDLMTGHGEGDDRATPSGDHLA